MGCSMRAHKHLKKRRRGLLRRLVVSAAAVAALLVFCVAAWIAWTVPKPWRTGIANVGAPCTQSFAGSPESARGAVIRVVSEPGEICGYAYALRPEAGDASQYVLDVDTGSVDDSTTLLVSLASYDGWRRLDRVRRRIEGPADLKGLRLAVEHSPRTTRVEVVTSVRGGGAYALQGVTLHPSTTPVAPGIALYREAMDVIAGNALNAAKLPDDFRTQWQPREDATSGEARRAIRQVLRALGDRHSVLLDPDRLAALPQQEHAVFKPATWKLLDSGLGSIQVPGFLGSDRALRARYTASITDALQAGTRAGVHAWVVDLRENRGGNMWPMLDGLEPLLRGQTLGWFQRRDGSRTAWRNRMTERAAQVSDLGRLPVAVLSSHHTASSGEAVVLAFRGRARTRSFGTPTHGLSTGNAGFTLQDGTVLQLTTTSFVDRTGQVHGGPIEPDERVDSLPLMDDAEAEAARWLRRQRLP